MRGTKRRRFKTVPIGSKGVFIDLDVQRVGCRRCGSICQTSLGFADPRFSYTRAFARYALELSKHMTIQDVAKHLSVSWDVIKEMQKRDLTRRFSKPCLKDLQMIAIDEISVRKGHRYLTVVLDMISGAVIFVGDSKGGDALDPFWKRIKHAKAQTKAAAMDMSPAYISAVAAHLPKATIVFDHFHVIKLFNERLSELRRDLSYYDYRISSAPLESTNNKIKTMKRMAYGFRDMEFFKLKIMALHETKYALVG